MAFRRLFLVFISVLLHTFYHVNLCVTSVVIMWIFFKFFHTQIEQFLRSQGSYDILYGLPLQ